MQPFGDSHSSTNICAARHTERSRISARSLSTGWRPPGRVVGHLFRHSLGWSHWRTDFPGSAGSGESRRRAVAGLRGLGCARRAGSVRASCCPPQRGVEPLRGPNLNGETSPWNSWDLSWTNSCCIRALSWDFKYESQSWNLEPSSENYASTRESFSPSILVKKMYCCLPPHHFVVMESTALELSAGEVQANLLANSRTI